MILFKNTEISNFMKILPVKAQVFYVASNGEPEKTLG